MGVIQQQNEQKCDKRLTSAEQEKNKPFNRKIK